MQGYYRLRGRRDATAVPRVFGAVANYGTPLSDEPIIFLKPASSIVQDGGVIRVPSGEQALFEGEVVVALGRGGRDVPAAEAMALVAGYGAGLDMTLARFRKNREQGLPWAMAKGFDTSTCLSEFVPAAGVPRPEALVVELEVNGEQRQRGCVADLITPIPGLIAWISRFITLEPGDLIFTGTPAGADAVAPGDRLRVRLPGLVEASFAVA
ncbi:MAG: fumarylacetoacetate hydrolase family protein [Chloroflexi bacterium]|nr:fumarylacetoacetate hydrolase family protein [Chloroflexota bacterium]